MEKEDFLIKFGKRLVELRKRKGWTQSELARNAAKSRQSIERIEKGRVNPSAYYIFELAEALGIEEGEFYKF